LISSSRLGLQIWSWVKHPTEQTADSDIQENSF